MEGEPEEFGAGLEGDEGEVPPRRGEVDKREDVVDTLQQDVNGEEDDVDLVDVDVVDNPGDTGDTDPACQESVPECESDGHGDGEEHTDVRSSLWTEDPSKGLRGESQTRPSGEGSRVLPT